MLTVIINVCLLKVMVSIELFKQSATHICLCLAQLSPQLPRPCSALPSTNVPQLFYDASVFLIAGTDKDKWAPFPPVGVCACFINSLNVALIWGVEWWKLSPGRILIWSCEHEKNKTHAPHPLTDHHIIRARMDGEMLLLDLLPTCFSFWKTLQKLRNFQFLRGAFPSPLEHFS